MIDAVYIYMNVLCFVVVVVLVGNVNINSAFVSQLNA